MSILEIAKKFEGELCDSCLGRQFALLGRGLSNRERGRAIRVLLQMEGRRSEEPKLCSLCLGLFKQIDRWAKEALKVAEDVEFETYLVGSRLPGFMEEKEQELRKRYNLKHGEAMKVEFNREVGKRFLDKRFDPQSPEVTFLVDVVMEEVNIKRAPLFIYGRYRKLVRGIPQTQVRWLCPKCHGQGCRECDYTGRMYKESIEELISPPILEAAKGTKTVFHGGGREDIDARMLGEGRPFVVEIKEPKRRKFDLRELEERINKNNKGKIEVKEIQFVKRKIVEQIKAERASKIYQLKVVFGKKVDKKHLYKTLEGLKGIIKQQTPARVSLHRADKLRERRVYDIWGDLVTEKEAVVKIKCEGGLYVKELISGDGGRTKPSLSELLGVRAWVCELDVLEILD
jgi:tRNA pseudouridine synthase 10